MNTASPSLPATLRGMRRFLLCTALAAAGLVASGGAGAAAAAPASVVDGVLVGPNQMTLYVFDQDSAGSGKSSCNGACAAN